MTKRPERKFTAPHALNHRDANGARGRQRQGKPFYNNILTNFMPHHAGRRKYGRNNLINEH